MKNKSEKESGKGPSFKRKYDNITLSFLQKFQFVNVFKAALFKHQQ
jgi:hypothetical protein